MTTPSKTLILVNPAAGGGRAQRGIAAVKAYLLEQGFQADFRISRSSEDLRQASASAASSGYGAVVALGGDGAVHQVLNGAFGRDLILGILPVGNGNDIAVGLGLPPDLLDAARVLLTCPPRAIDVIRVRFAGGEELCLGAGGVGLDSEAARLASGRFRRLPGVARYLAGAFWSLPSFRPLELDAELDGEQMHARVLLAAVANSPAYGSGVKIAPAARMDDGWLEVTLVAPLPWTRVLEAVPMLLQTGKVPWPELRRFRARRVRLRTDRPSLFQGDGEILGATPVELEVLPGAIRVLAPPAIGSIQ